MARERKRLAILQQSALRLLKSNIRRRDMIKLHRYSNGASVRSVVLRQQKIGMIPRLIRSVTPLFVLLNKEEKSFPIFDVACPFDTRVVSKEKEKIENYHDVKHEIKRISSCRAVHVIPIVIGALGTISRGFGNWLNVLGMSYYMERLQRVCLLGTGKIMRKVLDTRGLA